MDAVTAVDRDRLVRTFLELVTVDSPGRNQRIGNDLERRSQRMAPRSSASTLAPAEQPVEQRSELVALVRDEAGAVRDKVGTRT